MFPYHVRLCNLQFIVGLVQTVSHKRRRQLTLVASLPSLSMSPPIILKILFLTLQRFVTITLKYYFAKNQYKITKFQFTIPSYLLILIKQFLTTYDSFKIPLHLFQIIIFIAFICTHHLQFVISDLRGFHPATGEEAGEEYETTTRELNGHASPDAS